MNHKPANPRGLILGIALLLLPLALLAAIVQAGVLSGTPRSETGDILGGLGLIYVGLLFLLSYFFPARSFLFHGLMWFCEHVSMNPDKRNAFLYFGLGAILGGMALFSGLQSEWERMDKTLETQQAAEVLTDCYQFVFAGEMDSAALGRPFSVPKTLEEVPGWENHVAQVADPALRALYDCIDWHPPEDPSEGNEIASIALPAARAVVVYGGSAYAIRK